MIRYGTLGMIGLMLAMTADPVVYQQQRTMHGPVPAPSKDRNDTKSAKREEQRRQRQLLRQQQRRAKG